MPGWNFALAGKRVHLNNSGEGWGVEAGEARFHTPTPHFFEKLWKM